MGVPLGYLGSATQVNWLLIAPGGRRSICDIVRHLGEAKVRSQNKAFGDPKLTWKDPVVEDRDALASIPQAIEWLRACHARLRESIEGLDHGELLQLRPPTPIGSKKRGRSSQP